MIVRLPPGIGDIYWVLQKLSNTGRKFDFEICQDPSGRGMQLLDMFPQYVNSAKYGNFTGREVLQNCPGSISWARIKDSELVYLSANTWVDSGNRLDNWMPDVPLNENLWKEMQFGAEMTVIYGDYYCIYTSSIANVKRSGLWDAVQWAKFIKRTKRNTKFVILGASYDMDLIEQLTSMIKRTNFVVIDRPLNEVCTILQNSKGLISRASGIGCLAESMGVRTYMMYPMSEKKLVNSFARPYNINSRNYIGGTRKTTEETYNLLHEHWGFN